MTFKTWTSVSAVALIAMSVTSQATAQEWLDNLEPMTLKLADFSGDQNANFGKAMVAWEESITEFTDGKITFENYWSSSLLGALDTLSGVGDGVADIGLIIPSYMPQELPVGSWLFGMGAALSGSTVHDVAAGGAAALETVLTFEPLTQEYASHNVKVLQATATPAYNLLCNTPISTPEDAQGKRARAIGAVWSQTAEALGMTPVSIAWGEAYEGLQRGVFDCMVINPNQYADGLVLKDVAPEYVPVTMAQLQASTWVMNLDVWNDFPKELQDFITQANVKAAYDIWEGYMDIEAKAGELIAAGDVIHTNDVSALEPIAKEQRAAYVAGLADTAPDSVSDPQAFVDDYQARIAYWTEALVADGYEVAERTPEAIVDAFAGLSEVDLSNFYEKFNSEVTPGLMN
ncbi:TRAP-type C4-dicarboxylate transport system substrate-binding protein [Maritimibacter alkaliphilus HTCC2654]|uniref:C4-dicarboxylate TRAP transporter substrate-binding protein n=1 Tax=Maritimibacter alkaliphilus TaxID=404236 RepID=UPI0002DDF436|nr:C4-dicarboxylate TRAP transporter substrate-binding protein [Maritimibacter alkaliphilus]TYP85766.1 TRAP-type C4-dicarboxylate transport system substrate-binding protein [Maritimibacter alkaliphilus HTCC2654]